MSVKIFIWTLPFKNNKWELITRPDLEIAWLISQIWPQKDVSSAGESIIKYHLWNFLNKTEFLWKLQCWHKLELRGSRILECSMWRNSTESNRHTKKRSLYFIFSPLVGTFCVCPGLPQVEYAPLLFDNYNIAPEAVRIRNTGETESVVLSDILTSHRRSRAGVDGGSPG